MTDRQEVWVSAGDGVRDYPVIFDRSGRTRLPSYLGRFVPGVRRWAVISDSHVAPLYGREVAAALEAAGLGATLLVTPAGEREKTRERWASLTDRMLEEGFGRDAGVVAVGGGVVGDLAGFVAATFMRGIPVVQVPTSLLAMIDASVGGKTGVDTSAGKNLVGAFHAPSVVLADSEVVATLPARERRQGLVEAFKHGAILDDSYGESIAARVPGLVASDPGTVEDVVHRSVEIKAGVVSRDEHEGGLREILNFGHTVAHALEHASGYSLPHGTAVARGMLWEARLGERLGVTCAGTGDVLRRWLEPLRLPLDDETVDAGAFLAALRLDKKARQAHPRVVLLARPGEVAQAPDGGWSHPVPAEAILKAGLPGDS